MATISIAILSCDRPEMLRRTVNAVKGFADRLVVIDDASKFKPFKDVDFERFETRNGKRHFHRMMNRALIWHLEQGCDYQIVMPDDFTDTDIEAIKYYMDRFHGQYFALNLIRDDVERNWVEGRRVETTDVIFDRYIDCGFLTNKKTLSKIGYFCFLVPEEWFTSENKSSGVGHQLTHRFFRSGVQMYTPLKSICYHGTHDSVMHPQERKLNPIISK